MKPVELTLMSAGLLLSHLYAMRTTLGAVIASLEDAAGVMVETLDAADRVAADPDACPHPEEKQIDATTMGGRPRVMCLVCGTERPGTAPS
jgi:hypothetical protein